MKLRKVYAAVTAAACALSTMAYMPSMIMPTYASEIVHNDFEVTYDGWDVSDYKSTVTVEAVDGIGANGTRGMLVSNRKTVSDGTSSSKGLYLGGGVDYTYNFSVYSEKDSKFTINLTYVDEETGENSTTVNLIEEDVKGGEWTKLSTDFEAPEKTAEFRIDITNDNTDDFVIDDVIVTGEKSAEEIVSAAGNGLVSKFGGYFRVGNILNGNTVKNSGITANILKDCNAVECENETKPDATLPWKGQGCEEGKIPVRSDSFAAIADFCVKNNLGFRGHTMVWHSQTPSWFFKNNFQDGGQWVSKETMKKRLELYIKNMFEMYKTKYPTLNLYAYDVCNECINDGTGGAREAGDNNIQGQGGRSAWVQVYGDNSFIEDAFTYARMYAPPTCKLYYNDYNEFAGTKKNGIINSIIKPLKAKGLLDGMGMQSHIDASYNNAWGCTVEYLKAMDEYLALGVDVQVTELDISVDNGKYSYTQQADKYEAIFKHAMEYNSAGHANKVSLVQIWGPNDANSWLKAGSNALLYDSNNNPKEAYKRLMNMQTTGVAYDPSNPGGDGPVVTPEPDKNNWWLHYTFEDGEQGWSSRGTATVASSSQNHYTEYGSKSLSISGRDANWCGAGITLPYYIKEGESYSFSAHVKYDTGGDTDFFCMKLQYGSGDDTHYDTIAEGQAVKGEWVQLSNPSFKIPAGAGGGLLYLETHSDEGTTCDFYADEVIVAVDGTGIAGEGGAKVVTYSTADLDGNGSVNVGDYIIAKRLLKTGITNANLKKAADVDQSNKFDAEDVKLIHQFLMKKITEFPKAEIDYGDFDINALQQKYGNVTIASSWKADGENNPCTTQRFGADPGWMVYKDRLYLYTTADEFEYRNDGKMQENTYASGYINVISTADMVNWTDHGQIPVAKTRTTSNYIAKWANNAWAPDAAWKTINGKDQFFLYFANNGSGIGVITADDPTFSKNVKDPLGHELISRQTPNSNVTWLFDPGVYYDPSTDTGIIAYGGGVPKGKEAKTEQGRIAKLGSDMISIVGTPIDPGTPYLFEDSSMIKIGDTWYYSFCHNWNVPGGANVNGNSFSNADIGYMTSKDPTDPRGYSYQGVVFGNTGAQRIDNGGNNHHSVISFKDKLYVAYHSRQQAIRMVKGDNLQIYNSNGQLSADGNYRSTQVNEATMSGGKITCKGDMKGCSQIEKLDPFAKQQAETMQNQSKDIKISGLGDTKVVVKKGSWLKTAGVDFGSGASTLTVKASSKNGAVIKVATGKDASAMTYVEIPSGGQSTEITVPVVNSPTGSKDLYFIFNNDAEMDTWQFA